LGNAERRTANQYPLANADDDIAHRLCCCMAEEAVEHLLSAEICRFPKSAGNVSHFVDKTARHGVIWLEPRLTAEISYAEVMLGRLRAPVFRVPTQPVFRRLTARP